MRDRFGWLTVIGQPFGDSQWRRAAVSDADTPASQRSGRRRERGPPTVQAAPACACQQVRARPCRGCAARKFDRVVDLPLRLRGWCGDGWLTGVLKIGCLLMRWLFGLIVLVFREDQAKDAELLVLRHENAVLRRNTGRVRYEPADRVWFAVLARFILRRQWAEVFPVTPATLLAWHRRLTARKYDTTTRGRTGRPPTVRSIARIAVRLARENPLRGYRRIHGELTKLVASARRPLAMRSCAPRALIPRHAGPAGRGGSSCTRRPRGSWPSTFSMLTRWR